MQCLLRPRWGVPFQSGAESKVNQGPGSPRKARFDALKLAAENETLSGVLDARALGRVVDRLAAGRGDARIEWRIEGGRDALRRPELVVAVEGRLPLVCQRCLQAFDVPVAQETHLLLARDDDELKMLDAEESEVVLASALLDARTLVEDELLLSLPFAPHHADGECPPGTEWAPAGRAEATAGRRRSPFASLAELKKKR
jgi:uncharacterized protein